MKRVGLRKEAGPHKGGGALCAEEGGACEGKWAGLCEGEGAGLVWGKGYFPRTKHGRLALICPRRLLPPPSLYHPSGSSQCISPKHPVSCVEPGLAIHFLYDIIHVSMLFSQIIPPSPAPTESKRLFFTSVSLLLSRIQGIYALV